MRVNSIAYRLFTLAQVAGFLLTSLRSVKLEELTSPNATVVAFAICRLLGGSIVPAFLLWRNYTTVRNRRSMIPSSLMNSAPWYYVAAMTGVWLVLAATLVLPGIAVVAGYSAFSHSVSWSLAIGNLSAAALWFAAPTVLAMEVACAYHRDRLMPDRASGRR